MCSWQLLCFWTQIIPQKIQFLRYFHATCQAAVHCTKLSHFYPVQRSDDDSLLRTCAVLSTKEHFQTMNWSSRESIGSNIWVGIIVVLLGLLERSTATAADPVSLLPEAAGGTPACMYSLHRLRWCTGIHLHHGALIYNFTMLHWLLLLVSYNWKLATIKNMLFKYLHI